MRVSQLLSWPFKITSTFSVLLRTQRMLCSLWIVVFCPLNNAYNSACSDFLNQNQLNVINNGLFLEFGQLHGKRRSPRFKVKLVSNYVEFTLLILLLLLQSCWSPPFPRTRHCHFRSQQMNLQHAFPTMPSFLAVVIWNHLFILQCLILLQVLV